MIMPVSTPTAELDAEAAGAQSRGAGSRVADRPTSSWVARLVTLTLVAIGVGALWLTGGLAEVPAPPPAPAPTANVNDTVSGGPWDVAVTNAAAAADLGAYEPRTEGNWLLAVVVRIDVRTAQSQKVAQLASIATLPGLAGMVDADRYPLAVALVRDGSRVEYLHPGLPERVAFIFEMSARAPVPDEVVVSLKGWAAVMSFSERRLEWRDEVYTNVTVPVANRMADEG